MSVFGSAIDGVELKQVTESFRSENSKGVDKDGASEVREISQMGDAGVFTYGGFAIPPVRFPDVALSESSTLSGNEQEDAREDHQKSPTYSRSGPGKPATPRLDINV